MGVSGSQRSRGPHESLGWVSDKFMGFGFGFEVLVYGKLGLLNQEFDVALGIIF